MSTAHNITPRQNMTLGQLLTNEVRDEHVLNAMLTTPRERFVPPALAGSAYVDDELHLGNRRYLMAPLTFARLLAMADITPSDNVLDVGCNYGYSTAVIAHLAKEVVGCEQDKTMVEAARNTLSVMDIPNARITQVEKLSDGCTTGAPYDVIILQGSISVVPATLLRLLKDGGRFVTVEQTATRPGTPGGIGRLVAYVNRDGSIHPRYGREASVPPLPGFDESQGFVF